MRITFSSGRIASLDRLHQRRTYAGLLAGFPDGNINKGETDCLLGEGRHLHLAGCQPVLIAPRVTTTEHKLNGRVVNELRLPGIGCVACFESAALLRADSEPYSTLVVVWFQDRYALPIEPEYLRGCIDMAKFLNGENL